MSNLDIEKFNPTRGEIMSLVDKHKSLEIKGVDDKEGYALVKSARRELQTIRVQISKDGKLLRSEAVLFQKKVIEKEKELIALITPTESDLAEKQQIIDEEKLKIKRQELLPEYKTKLATIDCVVSDELLLSMTSNEFETYFNKEHAFFLNEKARVEEEKVEAAKIKAQEKRDLFEIEKKKVEETRQQVIEDRLELERQKQQSVDIERARVEAVEKEREEAQRQAVREREAAEHRLEEEAAAKKRADEEIAAKEAEEQKKFNNKKKYKKFLSDNNYINDGSFYLDKTLEKITLFKKVAEFNF